MSIFESNGIFDDDRVLHHDSYTPNELLARETQKQEFVSALKSVYRGSPPKNIVLRGKNGTGKTSLTKSILETLTEDCAKKGINVTTIYINCSDSNNDKSSYDITQEITNALREIQDPSNYKRIEGGFSQGELYEKMFDELESAGDVTIIILDELDGLGDEEILYKISRATTNGDLSMDTDVGLIGITNNPSCIENLSPTVKDSFCEEFIEFSTYKATELESILYARKDDAFVDGVLNEAVIPLCSAIIARDSGSARQALKLLEKSGELADDENADNVTDEHVRAANTQLHKDKVKYALKDLTTQEQLALLAVAIKSIDPSKSSSKVPTSDLFETYESIAKRHGHSALSYNRFSDRLKALEQQSLISLTPTRKSGNQNTFDLEVNPSHLIEVFDEIVSDRMNEEPCELRKTVEKIMKRARHAGEVSPRELTLETCSF